MMQQEAEIESAEKEGRPKPAFESLLADRRAPSTVPVPSDAETDIWSQIKPESRREYEKKLAELPPEQQEFERMAVLGELKANTGIAKKVEATFVEERIARMKRRESGQATLGDTIKYWWGWG
jgi:hypothetical protein